MKKHKFLTQEILRDFRKFWKQSETNDPMVICKFFDPCSQRTRYATEFSEDYGIFFWYVIGIEDERWTFSLEELESYKWRLGIWIERDAHFKKCRFSKLNLGV